MKIIIELTEKEKELLALIKAKGSLSTYDNFGGFGDTVEFKALRDGNLIYHNNHESHGDYIRYGLTDLGEQAFIQNS